MLEPQSTALFIVLMVAFCGLLAWVALSRQAVFRVLAASLAFLPAMLFGVAAVNKYYDYYQTWGAIAADFGAQSATAAPSVTSDLPSRKVNAILSQVTKAAAAGRQGETVRFTVTGRGSHITRAVYVYLPPQYFLPRYRAYRFPAIELITGQPGEPQDWINVARITQTFHTLLGDGAVKPAVLIMPDANGGRQFSLQCLNIPRGPQDARFLVREVPGYFARTLRVQPPGPAWGVAGYSEGGYCAANIALVYRRDYGAAGVLSGYFKPGQVRFGNPVRHFYPFHKYKRLRLLNTPLDRIRALPVSASIPRFWLGAGSLDTLDVRGARMFQRLLVARQPGVQLRLAPGGGHTMTTWRALIPPMLEWMTPRLARAASAGVPAKAVRQASSRHLRVSPVGAGRQVTASPAAQQRRAARRLPAPSPSASP